MVARAIADRRDQVVLVTKFANVRGENEEFLGIRGAARYVRQACDARLRRLGDDHLVAYSPLGRGFLTGQYTARDASAADAFRAAGHPGFPEGNLEHILAIAAALRELAAERGVTAGLFFLN